jgi:hypothetical protein
VFVTTHPPWTCWILLPEPRGAVWEDHHVLRTLVLLVPNRYTNLWVISRQISFLLSWFLPLKLAFSPAVQVSIKLPLDRIQFLFNAYHERMQKCTFNLSLTSVGKSILQITTRKPERNNLIYTQVRFKHPDCLPSLAIHTSCSRYTEGMQRSMAVQKQENKEFLAQQGEFD